MTDRHFPNEMPDFVPESEEAAAAASDPLRTLLALPYPTAAERFLRAAVELKDKVVKETWISYGCRVKDYTLYTGSLGTAYLLLKSYTVTKNKSDLSLCNEIIKACFAASRGSDYVTFICGRTGVCALGAVAAKHSGDESLLHHYLGAFKEIKLPAKVPNELLYGRSGYLWACSFLNAHIGIEAIPAKQTGLVAKDVIFEGRKLSSQGASCPLMYEWHGKKYWGAAHGLAGIMHVLMDMGLKPEEQDDVKATLRYMIQNRFPSGNYPSSEENQTDRLVHWCHGSPGVALTLSKAANVFQDEQFLQAAAEAAEVVWNRGLLKRVGICHGISGNAYVSLSLYRLTSNPEYLYRARAFASFLLENADKLIANGEMHGGDRPYSLFEGQAGMANLFFDMAKPLESRFPAYEI